MDQPQEANWARVDAALRPTLQEKIGLLREVLGPALLSVTLFGEVVTGGFDRRLHSVRSVVVLNAVELAALRRLAEHGPRLAKAAMTAPVAVTPKYVQDSLDTFPLEWLEIQQRGVAVWGPDQFSGLVLDSEYIRLQCEREIKRLLMGLRQALLAATGRQSAVALIERDFTDCLMRTLRGMLWLQGRREHLSLDAVVEEIEKLLGVRFEGIRAAMDTSSRHDWSEFDRLYGDVELLMGKADVL